MVLAGSLGGLAGTYGSVMMAAGANRRVFEILDGPEPAIPLDQGARPDRSRLHCSLLFRDVCFSYPTRPDQAVLSSVSFEIPAGQKVALVGRSGCGKSTIINLIMRFYDPLSGSIELGGLPLSSIAPAWLHTTFGLVAQEPLLFGMTIEENIAFGVEEDDGGAAATARAEAAVAAAVPEPAAPLASLRKAVGGRLGGGLRSRAAVGPAEGGLAAGEEGDSSTEARARGGSQRPPQQQPVAAEVVAAAKMANAHEFIQQFEDGYRTLVGERGVQLSGALQQQQQDSRPSLHQPPAMWYLRADRNLVLSTTYLTNGATAHVYGHTQEAKSNGLRLRAQCADSRSCSCWTRRPLLLTRSPSTWSRQLWTS
jgi:ABC-type multidrug transport system fused ATPase/permease subunit